MAQTVAILWLEFIAVALPGLFAGFPIVWPQQPPGSLQEDRLKLGHP